MPAWGASFSSSDGVASARLFLPLAFLLAFVLQLREWLHGCVYGCPWPIFRRPLHRVPLPVISVLAVLSVWATLNCRSASELWSTEPHLWKQARSRFVASPGCWSVSELAWISAALSSKTSGDLFRPPVVGLGEDIWSPPCIPLRSLSYQPKGQGSWRVDPRQHQVDPFLWPVVPWAPTCENVRACVVFLGGLQEWSTCFL